MWRVFLRGAGAVLAAACVACGSSGTVGSGFTQGTGDGGMFADAGFGDGSGFTGDGQSSGGGDSATNENAEVFGESPDTLYKLDPVTKAVSIVGTFSGCDSEVIDIALDKDSNMYGTTYGGVYRIDRTTAACTLIALGDYPNSLSFVPAGTLDPNVEALVGYNGDQYVRIDTTTGALTTVGGTIGGNLQSSGDIVSVKGGGTYLTVKGGNCATDCLIEVNPATGALVTNYGETGYSSVFGLAFWAGAVYGFDDGGDLFEVDFTGGTIHQTMIPIPNAPSGLEFYGAGSTTSAPTTPTQ